MNRTIRGSKAKENETHSALALPCLSSWTLGTPSRTNRAKRDCSMLEYFWNAWFCTTGGSWWWSPIIHQRFSRFLPSWGFWNAPTVIYKTSFIYRQWQYSPVTVTEWKSPLLEFALLLPWECCRIGTQAAQVHSFSEQHGYTSSRWSLLLSPSKHSILSRQLKMLHRVLTKRYSVLSRPFLSSSNARNSSSCSKMWLICRQQL